MTPGLTGYVYDGVVNAGITLFKDRSYLNIADKQILKLPTRS